MTGRPSTPKALEMTSKPSQLETSNLLEVEYMLDRGHRVSAVTLRKSWPYGIPELCVLLEGEQIDLDRMSFLRHGLLSHTNLRLDEAFKAVLDVLWRQAEGGLE